MSVILEKYGIEDKKQTLAELLSKKAMDFGRASLMAPTKVIPEPIKAPIKKASELYLTEAQPAFKYGATGKLESQNKSWEDILREELPALSKIPIKKERYFKLPWMQEAIPVKGTLREYPYVAAGQLLEAGTKPSTFITWYAAQKTIPVALQKAIKKLPPKWQNILTQEIGRPKAPADINTKSFIDIHKELGGIARHPKNVRLNRAELAKEYLKPNKAADYIRWLNRRPSELGQALIPGGAEGLAKPGDIGLPISQLGKAIQPTPSKVYIAKYKMPDGSVGQTGEYDTPGMAAANVKKGAEFYRVESKLPTPSKGGEIAVDRGYKGKVMTRMEEGKQVWKVTDDQGIPFVGSYATEGEAEKARIEIAKKELPTVEETIARNKKIGWWKDTKENRAIIEQETKIKWKNKSTIDYTTPSRGGEIAPEPIFRPSLMPQAQMPPKKIIPKEEQIAHEELLKGFKFIKPEEQFEIGKPFGSKLLEPTEEEIFAGMEGVETGLAAEDINQMALEAEIEKTGLYPEELKEVEVAMGDYKKGLFSAIKELGKIKPHMKEDELIPPHLKDKNGQTLDDMVSQLDKMGFSFESEDELRQTILSYEQRFSKLKPKETITQLIKIVKKKPKYPDYSSFIGAGIKGELTMEEVAENLERISRETQKYPYDISKLATNAQKALAHIIAKRKKLTPSQMKRLEKVFTGKSTMATPSTPEEAIALQRRGIEPMTKLEAEELINSLKGIVKSRRPGKPPTLPTTKKLTPQGYFEQKFKTPTIAKFVTPQDRYIYVLGLQDILNPSVEAKMKMDLERQRIYNWMDKLEKTFLKGKITPKERAISALKNIPSSHHVRMWNWLNTPGMDPNIVPGDDRETYMQLRKLTDDMIARTNEIRDKVGLEPIRYLEGYVRYIYDLQTNKEIREKYPFPPDIEHWLKIIHPKHIFNPTAIERMGKMGGLLKDPFKALKAMVSSDLKQIYLEHPNLLYREQLEALSKAGVLPEETRQWAEDFMNVVIKKYPSEVDKLIDRSLETLKIPQIMNWILQPFGRVWGPQSINKIGAVVGRLIHDALIWGRIKLVIRNHTQKLLSHGLYGSKAFAKAVLPENKQLKYFIDSSNFYNVSRNSYMESVPKDIMSQLEKIGFMPYGHSHAGRIGGNVPFTMKAAYHASMELVKNPKYAKYGWTMEDVIKEMDYGANTAQYWYNMVGMPELYRHKSLGILAKLQSWSMNYAFKYWRELLHRAFTGKTGWGKPIPPKWRVGAIRHVLGTFIFIEGLRRAFGLDYRQIGLLGILPTYLSPAGQLSLGLYQYLTARTDWQRQQAKKTLERSYRAFIPGSGAWREVAQVWSGEKPIKSLFFHTVYEKKDKKSSILSKYGLDTKKQNESKSSILEKYGLK